MFRSSVLWQVELRSDEIRYLAKISKQNIEAAAWVLLAASSEKQEGREESKKELLNGKEFKLGNLEYSQPI